MEFHSKMVFPKYYLDMNEDKDFANYIRGKVLADLAKSLEPYVTYEENEVVCDPVDGPWKYTQECTCTLDVCLPTKLIPAGAVKGDSVFYCERCLERAKETNTKVLLGSGTVQFDAPIYFDWCISKYCPDCGSRFTNITKGEDGRYTVIKEEE